MLRPTPKAGFLAVSTVPVALVIAMVGTAMVSVWVAWSAVVVSLAVLDGLWGPRKKAIGATPSPPARIYIGDHSALPITFSAPRKMTLRAVCDLNDILEPQPVTSTVVTAEDAVAEVALIARRRGIARADAVWIKWRGPLGLIERSRKVPLDVRIPVVPNTHAVVKQAARLAVAVSEPGLARGPRGADGSELYAVREYVTGMNHKQIDWKRSAHHGKLVCKEMRVERNRQVILAVDTGRLMTEHLGGIPKLDHAVTCALMVAYAGTRAGDHIGLAGFSAGLGVWADPGKGLSGFRRIEDKSAELAYSTVETNFTLALSELSTRLRRRSLIVLFTDFVDSVTAELMIDNVAHLCRRHVVAFVALRDASIDDAALAPPTSIAAMHRAVAASELAGERQRVLARLRRLGVHLIDAPPERLSAQAIERYLDI
ncbi:MAG TPA: DUF58 domain-containing protein, partial [Kofleriaceae bacterium]|nr:DUF58 domain-containing protein [Kofleriaceae bacterium]